MLHYFINLPKDKTLNPERNKDLSYAIMKTAKDALTPFFHYIKTSIKALERKEDIKAEWKKVKENNLVELETLGDVYEVPKTTKVRLLNIEKGIYTITGVKEKDFDEPLICWINGQKEKITISQDNFISSDKIKLPFEHDKIEKASWAGESLKLEPNWITLKPNDEVYQKNKKFKVKSVQNDIVELSGSLENSKITHNNKNIEIEIISQTDLPTSGQIIQEEENRYIIYAETQIKNAKRVPNIFPFIDVENIVFEDGSKFTAEHHEGMTFRVQDLSVVDKKVVSGKIKFVIKNLKNDNKDQFWIQLEEIEEIEEIEDDIPGYSPLKYFFDDGVSIQDDKGNIYSLFQGIESEYKLILKRGKNEFCFPKGEILEVKVNTYQFRKQLEAILTLQNMPVREHSNLIKLFEKRDKVQWAEPKSKLTLEWVVLTDENRSGVKEQREFVQKALQTPDFAILEGPPGSGKTTVILELICQLAKQGKRVLLCGSTHVAIDNVLERLKEKRYNEQNLIQKFNILPVRIGDENRISEEVKEFQIDKLINRHQIAEDLLLDAANLVCGTTIGILQHPHFKQRDTSYNPKTDKFTLKEPIVPEFDYLIIDECSKTTFQEFLVPALYAKKWVLVGDVMQLAPFTDREQIAANLETLPLKEDKQLPKEYQLAVFYLHKLFEIVKYAKNKFVLPVSQKVISALKNEIEARRDSINNIVIKFFDHQISRLELTASDVIVIDEGNLKQNLHNLPETHAVLRYENWQFSEHAFIHNSWQNKGNFFKARIKNKELENSFEIVEDTNKFFKERSWADEIAWRIDREHQLRLLDEQKTDYRKVIKELIPFSLDKEDIESRINTIASVAFPSILESLIKGIPARFKQTKTTLSEGLNPQELEHRRIILKYQHRMHPDISKFPRERFYIKEGALLDLANPKPIHELRQWNYNRYSKRSIWIDVKGKVTKNYNKDEVKILISELEKFIEFASNHSQPEGKEWAVACLTFYKGQETRIREQLQKLTGKECAFSNFNISKNNIKINIKLHTVDKFQGQEADIVFLSMVQTHRDGFLDNPNRLNVAITRAKFQLVILGDYDYFSQKSHSEELKQLALNTTVQRI